MSTIAQQVKRVRARARIRAWEYRQRHHAHGAWLRYRRALSFAERAYAISEAEVERLVGDGGLMDTGGQALAPARVLVWITPEQAARLEDPRPLRLHLDATLLGERWIAVVPFEAVGVPPPMVL